MALNASFWSGRRVLLTGHTGFKGSWMARWLDLLGAHVSGFAQVPPTSPSLYDVARVKSRLAMEKIGDVRDLAETHAFMEAQRPEIVIHMAAQSLVRKSYNDPVETFATNVMGTVNVLDAVRRTSGVRVVIIVTSDKCYENREWEWGYRETDPLGGFDPYSSSKGCSATPALRKSECSTLIGQTTAATPLF